MIGWVTAWEIGNVTAQQQPQIQQQNIVDIILIVFKVRVDSIVEIYVNLSVPIDVKVVMVEAWT